MSSRIIRPDDPHHVAPLALRQVLQSGEANPTGGTEVQERFAAQVAQIEQHHQQQLREAHAAGVREGEVAGKNRAVAENQPVIERLAHTIDELSQMRARLRKEAEGDMVKLSLAIARRVLRRELAIDPEALHGLVMAALEKLQGQDLCRVKVHPSHAALIKTILQKTVTGTAIEVIPDPSRELGTAIFETQRGNLDASVDSQLREIERGLADCLRKHS
jgi:flagellar assembly protein FliH